MKARVWLAYNYFLDSLMTRTTDTMRLKFWASIHDKILEAALTLEQPKDTLKQRQVIFCMSFLQGYHSLLKISWYEKETNLEGWRAGKVLIVYYITIDILSCLAHPRQLLELRLHLFFLVSLFLPMLNILS